MKIGLPLRRRIVQLAPAVRARTTTDGFMPRATTGVAEQCVAGRVRHRIEFQRPSVEATPGAEGGAGRLESRPHDALGEWRAASGFLSAFRASRATRRSGVWPRRATFSKRYAIAEFQE